MPFMRSESCSFIWHPNVVTWYRFIARRSVAAGLAAGDRDDPRLDGAELDFVVVGLHRVRHGLWLLVAPRQLASDERMGPLDLVRHGLADVVQERRAPRRLRTRAELCCEQGGE